MSHQDWRAIQGPPPQSHFPLPTENIHPTKSTERGSSFFPFVFLQGIGGGKANDLVNALLDKLLIKITVSIFFVKEIYEI